MSEQNAQEDCTWVDRCSNIFGFFKQMLVILSSEVLMRIGPETSGSGCTVGCGATVIMVTVGGCGAGAGVGVAFTGDLTCVGCAGAAGCS